MMKTTVLRKAATLMTALVMPLAAVAQSAPLSLKQGVYVARPYPCKGAPNTAILQWDGTGFSGAHSSKCTTRVLSHVGTRYDLSTTCSAMGDGSPDTSGYVDLRSLTRVSESAFAMQAPHQDRQAFRWCSAKNVD